MPKADIAGYSIASSGREQQRWNFEAECFARPQLNQGLAWLVAATVALCSVHSPGPGLTRMVAAMAASCSEHFPGLELTWFVLTAAFCLEHSLGRPYDFAERLFDATRLGMRVIVAPNDVAPVEIDHPALFQPKTRSRHCCREGRSCTSG